MIITMRDVRAVRICSGGARQFCVRHNIDWMDFLKNGIESDKLSATGDAMALRIVEVANGRK